MPTAEEQAAAIKRLGNRSVAEGRQPIEGFTLSELPPEVVRAFPTLETWRKDNNARIVETFKKMNVVLPV